MVAERCARERTSGMGRNASMMIAGDAVTRVGPMFVVCLTKHHKTSIIHSIIHQHQLRYNKTFLHQWHN